MFWVSQMGNKCLSFIVVVTLLSVQFNSDAHLPADHYLTTSYKMTKYLRTKQEFEWNPVTKVRSQHSNTYINCVLAYYFFQAGLFLSLIQIILMYRYEIW